MKQKLDNDYDERYEGYADWEISNLIRGCFRKYSSVHIRKRIPEEVLDQIPVLVLVQLYLEKIDIAGGLNLSETYRNEEDIEAELNRHPAARKIDFHSNRKNPALEIEVELSDFIISFCHESKLTKDVKSKRYISRKGRSLLKNGNKLLRNLLHFFTYEYFPGGWDEFGDTVTGQLGIGFSLILLNKYGYEKRTDNFYAKKYLDVFPQLIEPAELNLTGKKLRDHYAMIYRYRFFNFYCRLFNLIEEYDASKKKKRNVEISDVFIDLFNFLPSEEERKWAKNFRFSERKFTKRVFENFTELEDREWESEEELQKYLDSLIGKALPRSKNSKKLRIDHEVESLIREAEQCESAEEGIKLLKQAEEKGKTHIGKQFEEFIGNFWAINPTRPYMKALMAQVEFYQKWNYDISAIRIMERMLVLDPDDHLGVRNKLGILQVLNGLYEKYEKLRGIFPDEDDTLWLYTDAIYCFCRYGKSPSAKALIKKATARNKFLAEFIIKNYTLPATIPESYLPGDRNEARLCLRELQPLVAQTEDFRDFLREIMR
ncbi:MAG: hypothetical protein K9N06_00150 [Candidatus Cloacimonetes bacterium]|nr:hypothetical protein [Candidatus Cloacimonadota bacterium]